MLNETKTGQKLVILMGIGITALVVGTFAYYILANPTIELFDMISIPIILIIILTSSYVIYDRAKNIKKGLPAQDERLKIAGYKAGYYGFIAAIWSAVGSNMLSIILFDEELRGGLVTAAVVLISGITFMLAYYYFSRKGE
ncbi:MAG: hypothetical protein BV457_01940 [Thermoplasmata archaeon M9B1D]|nr:MAG: hypothetical protein BV457_01940 [Thermoplasmata archaeon M9B1D]PNX51104.1 MAG: hypothetical protein BV456_04415 [Thermoplasmata archaeon M8B2D]